MRSNGQIHNLDLAKKRMPSRKTLCAMHGQMNKQRQHYVPKVYLKEFTRDRSGHFYAAGPRPKHLTSIDYRHVEQVCYSHNFYTLRENTKDQAEVEDNNFLEKKAFDYEKRLLPRIIDKLRHKNVYLNKSYHDSLIDIYLNLKQRNLFYRHNFIGQDMSALTDKQIDGMKPLKSWIEEMSGESFDNFMGKIKEKIILDTDLPAEMHKQTLIESAFGKNDAINKAKECLKRMTLYVFEPLNNSDYFLTSDNPGFSLLGDKVFNTNFGRFDAVGFPISSRQTVFLTGNSKQNQLEILKRINFVKLDTKRMDLINYCTIFNSNEYVFCETKKYLTELVKRFESEHGTQQNASAIAR